MIEDPISEMILCGEVPNGSKGMTEGAGSVVVGTRNVTPDSFPDCGDFLFYEVG